MRVIKALVCIIGGIAALLCALLITVARALGKFVHDIYNDQDYWGGKD